MVQSAQPDKMADNIFIWVLDWVFKDVPEKKRNI